MSPSLSCAIHLGEKTDKEAKKELLSRSTYRNGACCCLQELLQNLSTANYTQKQGKVPVHVTNAYRGSRGTAPLIPIIMGSTS
jgi:hypothetical protein